MSLLNTLFTAHRLSPLHIGPEPLTPARLELLSRRLRDLLVGDSVRGVQLGLDTSDAALLGQAGALERVEFGWVGLKELLRGSRGGGNDDAGGSDDEDGDNDGDGAESPQALRLALKYENSGSGTYAAFLLPELPRDAQPKMPATRNPFKKTRKSNQAQQWTAHPLVSPPSDTSQPDAGGVAAAAADDRFTHLPLLLLKLPAPLRTVVTEFLAQTFDTRVSPLKLDSPTLVAALELWIAESGSVSSRDVGVTLAFRTSKILKGGGAKGGIPPLGEENAGVEQPSTEGHPGPADDERQTLGLKTVDVVIPAEEVSGFVRAGGPEQPKGRRAPLVQTSHPFTDALAAYLDHHLALDIKHPAVRILRVTCDGFVLSEGRVKILAAGDGRARKAASALLSGLVYKAKGNVLTE